MDLLMERACNLYYKVHNYTILDTIYSFIVHVTYAVFFSIVIHKCILYSIRLHSCMLYNDCTILL